MKRKPKKQDQPIKVTTKLTTVHNPQAAADLFAAILRGVRSARKRREESANGGSKPTA